MFCGFTLEAIFYSCFDTSDRPYDNKTGGVEAIGNYKSFQYGVIAETAGNAGLGLARANIATEVVVGTTRVGIAFSDQKEQAIFERAVNEPNRFGLIYAVRQAERPLS